MRARTGSGLGGHALLLLAVCGLAAVLAPASCTLDVQGTGPETPGTGGTGPGVGGMGPGVGGMGTSTSSSSSSSAGGSGGQGGVTPPPPEECLDGVDNDMDGLIDCADVDDCAPAEYECAPEAPGGWTGQVRAVTVAEGETLPDCPAGMTQTDFHAGPVAAACTACACTWDAAMAECSAPEATCWFGNNFCMVVNPSVYAGAQDGTCFDFNVSGFGSCRITGAATVLNPGTCTITPGGGELANPSLWAEAVRVCAGNSAVGAGCGDGQVCMPRPAPTTPALGDTICITRDGMDECPAGWLDIDTQLYTSGTEGRSCGACTCDTATVGCAGGSMRAYDYNNCDGNGQDFALGNQCSNLDNYIEGSFSLGAVAATPTQPTCAGGAPSGQVMTDGPVKLCCHAQPALPPPP